MIVGSCPACGKTLFRDSRFVRDQMNAWCPDHAPERPGTPPVETRHGSCTPGREAVPLARERPVAPKGTSENPIASQGPYEPPGSGAPLTKEDVERAFDKIGIPHGYAIWPPKGAEIVTNVPIRSDRWQAAERLARLVAEIETPDDNDRVRALGRLSPPPGQRSLLCKEEIEEEAKRIAWNRKAPLCREILVAEARKVLGQ